METLYIDILNALEIKPALDLSKRKENEELKEIVEEIKFEIINKINNPNHLKKIKEKIKEIGRNHHLRIEHLLDNDIDEKELEFALKIIYQVPEIKQLNEKIKDYKEEENALLRINKILENIKEKKHNILIKISELKEIIDNKEKNPFKKIKNQLIKKRKIKSLKKEIIEIIEKTKNEIIDDNKIEQVENELDIKITRKNIDEIYIKIDKKYKEIIDKLKEIKNLHTKTSSSKRISIKLPQEQLNRIIYINEKNYLFTITSTSFINDKYKKEQLITKIIFILKAINIIEKNKTKELNEIHELLKSNESFKEQQIPQSINKKTR